MKKNTDTKKTPPNKTAAQAAKKLRREKKVVVKNVHQALLKFQNEAIILPRNGKGKSNDNKEYRFSTLDDTINICRPFLAKYGLGFTQTMVDNKLVTTLFHADSGTSITSDVPLSKPEKMQDLGASITYARRYGLTSILGLSAEEDSDANPVKETVLPQTDKPSKKDVVMMGSQETGYQPVEVAAKDAKDAAPSLSVAFTAAESRIKGAFTNEVLTLLSEKIAGSDKLEDFEKEELQKMIDGRREEFIVGGK